MNPLVLYSVITLVILASGSAMIIFLVAKKFTVDEDPRIDEVAGLLPGANCGGCGNPGCRGLAEALVKGADAGDISALLCPPGGNTVMAAIAHYLGMAANETIPQIAVVRCGGSCEKAPAKLTYDGPKRCVMAHQLFSGESGCPSGCLGLGDCVRVCKFDAIFIDPGTGLPEVNKEKCVACGACVKSCPRSIMQIRPQGKKERRVWINCVNTEKGAIAKKNCTVACIACGKCVQECPEKIHAISITNNLAYIDFEKCIACGMCVPVCPTGAILATFTPPKSKIEKKPTVQDKKEEVNE